MPDNYNMGENNRTCNENVGVTKESDKQMGRKKERKKRKEKRKDNEVDGERNGKWQSDRIPHLASLKTQISQCPTAVKST